MRASCAAALDGCIYFMPYNARCIMKLDPNNGDAMSSVGDGFGDGYGMYTETIVGIDGCVYGIPYNSKRILKYDPINEITSFVGEGADTNFMCKGNGALGRDECIYVIIPDRKILKIDTTNNSHCFVGNSVESEYYHFFRGCSDAIFGIDGCIYWPPAYTRRILKYDPHANKTSLVGDDYGYSSPKEKWFAGSLACSNFCPFMIVASYQESSVSAIYHFLRQDLSRVNGIGSPKL